MAYDIRLMKLVTGELVIGKYDAAKDSLTEVAAIQMHSHPAGRADDDVALWLSL